MFEPIAGLDPAQAEAVAHGDGPLVILAGAGTGKTRTLTARVAALIERGERPEKILLLTFTRRAAADMISRAAALCGNTSAARRIWGGTFHAIAHQLVTEHAAALGLAAVTLLDPADVVDLLDVMRDEFDLSGTQVRLPTAQAMADICSRSINTGRPARDVIALDFPQYEHTTEQILALLNQFMTRKRRAGLLDFDDLLLAMRALLTDPVVGDRIRARWDHVLVDEYQDVNQIQVDIVTALRPDGIGLTVVGDDAQAVYGFRGAHSAHLLAAATRHPGTTVVRLETNFRSVQPVLGLANLVRPADNQAHSLRLRAARDSTDASRPILRVCYDVTAQAGAVADAVLAAREDGTALRDQAVLMRAGNHGRELEFELTARRIPYLKYGGLRFIETAHVKDLIAVLRLSGNPHDELALYRLFKLHRHIGKAHARTPSRLLSAASRGGDAEGDQDSGGGLDFRDRADRTSVVAAAPGKARRGLAATLDRLADAAQTSVPADRIVAGLDLLRPLIRTHYDDAALRMDDLDRLGHAAAASSNLDAFLAGLVLDPAGASTDYARRPQLDDDYLVLSTVHSAKGLEWDNVHLIHAADGTFPSDMALTDPDGLAEEARLFYVAVTRARNQLSIYHPQRMHPTVRGDRHVYTQRSRFLDDRACNALDTEHLEPVRAAAAEPSPVGHRITIPAMSELFA